MMKTVKRSGEEQREQKKTKRKQTKSTMHVHVRRCVLRYEGVWRLFQLRNCFSTRFVWCSRKNKLHWRITCLGPVSMSPCDSLRRGEPRWRRLRALPVSREILRVMDSFRVESSSVTLGGSRLSSDRDF